MPTTETQITFEPILPPMPMVLAGPAFLRTLAEVEVEVKKVHIVDAETAQAAANLQIRLTSAGKKLDEARLAAKRPWTDIAAAIDDIARAPKDRIEGLKTQLRNAQVDWDTRQRQAAAAAEAARKAELERLEKKRKEEAAEAAKKAAELAKIAAEAAAKSTAEVLDVDFGDDAPAAEPPPKTETEKEIERIKFTPAPVVEKPTGLAYRASMRHRVEDVNKLPDQFVNRTANDTAIRQVFCNGWKDGEPMPVCPGVTFFVERTAVSTGKVAF